MTYKDRHIGDLIRAFRKKKDLTQEQMAEKLYISQQQFQKYESWVSQPPIDTLVKIVNILEIPLQKIFGETERTDLVGEMEERYLIHDKHLLLIEENPEIVELIKLYDKYPDLMKRVDIHSLLKNLLKLPPEKIKKILALFAKIIDISK